MDSVLFLGVDADLGDGEDCGEEGVIGEEDVVEVNLACLLVVDEIPIGVVDAVEQEAGEVHGYEVEVHALDTENNPLFTS